MRRAGGSVLALIVILSLASAPVRAATGGPDAYGYVFQDSASAGGPAYDLVDISTTGAPVSLDSYGNASVAIPFPFSFYGDPKSTLYVNGYGLLTFAYTYYAYYAQTIPSSYSPNDLIAGYWPLAYYYGGSIFTQVTGDAPNRQLLVEYKNMTDCYYCSGTVTMEFKLFETSNAIEVHYAPITASGYTHSAGIENADGSVGLSYMYGTTPPSSAAAVRYFPVPPPSIPTLLLPTSAEAGATASGTIVSSDPSGYDVTYSIDWGDGSHATRLPSSGTAPQGESQSVSHIYRTTGSYAVTAFATNTLGLKSPSFTTTITVVDDPPDKPSAPGAPAYATTLLPVQASVVTTDPNGDDIAYFIDWGDGTIQRAPHAGFVASGARSNGQHTYKQSGTFHVTAWAVDTFGSESAHSDPALVQVIA